MGGKLQDSSVAYEEANERGEEEDLEQLSSHPTDLVEAAVDPGELEGLDQERGEA